MVTLVVATTIDAASIGPASALLSMPGWQPGPPWPEDAQSFVNKEVRLIKLGNRLVKEDHLDKRWEEATGESVNEVIFLSKHVASSSRPALTIHPIGTPHISEGEVLVAGGKAGWVAPPNPRIGPWLRLLKTIAASHNLSPEFEVTLEATHHGPVINSPTMFVEIGSTEEYWRRQDAAQTIALLVWQGLGLGEGISVGDWPRNNGKNKILFGIGGGHYVPRHMDIVLSFKSWQRNAIKGFLVDRNIKIGKPSDF
ncbi:D-aminoacyl-tRNA deacylase isoform X2 [Manihot esculenta]|uniref:D-aminoacyl-tRNA deacylase n=1 Tax=Manihot esculenta TaxID=3983 RepID=A0A2C9VQB6_MANES|nr:D-aminoacyl-tRNA deacylase isoform X2 [Manihot esculenta]